MVADDLTKPLPREGHHMKLMFKKGENIEGYSVVWRLTATMNCIFIISEKNTIAQ